MEYQNYFRLHILLYGEGSEILRKIFKRRYRQLKNIAWESNDKSSTEFLQTFSMSNISLSVRERQVLKVKDLGQYDVPLLSYLINHIYDSLPGPGKLKKKQKGQLKSEKSAIAELVKLRNTVAHFAKLSVDADEFEELWERFRVTLMNLGVAEGNINKIRSKYHFVIFQSADETMEQELDEVKFKQGDVRGKGEFNTSIIANYSRALLNHKLPDNERITILMNGSEALLGAVFGITSLPSQNVVNEKYQRALANVKEIIHTYPESFQVYLKAVKIHQCTTSWKSVIDMFDQALALNPVLHQALKHCNECRIEISREDGRGDRNPETTQIQFQKNVMVDDIPSIKNILKKAASEALLESIFGTAGLPIKNDFNETRHRVMANVEDLIKDPNFRQDLLLIAGKICHYSKSWKSAIDIFDQVLALNPEMSEALKLRNECNCKIRKGEERFQPNPQNVVAYSKTITPDVVEEYKKLKKNPDDNKRASAYQFFGNLFETGTNVMLDYKMARRYYKEAIKLGCTQSMCALGCMYTQGRGTALDIEKGVQLIERAARTELGSDKQSFYEFKVRGVASAQRYLGLFFENGHGKPKDLVQATKWYQRASINGSATAAHSLGKLFYRKKDVPRNYQNAQQYWRLAASRGNEQSMVLLAKMYQQESNPDLAEQWFNKALKRGNECAIRNKDEFLSSLAEQRRAIKECEKIKVKFTPEDASEKRSPKVKPSFSMWSVFW